MKTNSVIQWLINNAESKNICIIIENYDELGGNGSIFNAISYLCYHCYFKWRIEASLIENEIIIYKA